jgi:hypothetical protein
MRFTHVVEWHRVRSQFCRMGFLKSKILPWFLKAPAPGDDADRRKVLAFIDDLNSIAASENQGHFRFNDSAGTTLGFAQLHCYERQVQIHRLWACKPGGGAGSNIMRTLCELADRHRVEMRLKVVPIGRKPFPMSRQQLRDWYLVFGFAGAGWTLIRKPVAGKLAAII